MKVWIQKYRTELVYLLFGALTTAVNYLVYLPVFYGLGFSAAVSNGIAWVAAVLFAFFTNKPFVFESHDWSRKTVFKEFSRFVACRVGSGAVETAFVWITVDILLFSGTWMKVIASIFVIILNYFGSKLLVFRKNNGCR